ncbi:hypothetical protein [Enterovibrio nigricans]|uniref:Uncharacterized protein n=1 Tax=Enterovibrio nigricans DSM 22720 TaxID=1121868 RepID=A0A1T4V5T9_9GAMM|nr:hypothetical protein [Enterovibrio nigricans]PKF49889.1 hypothetical protein AT251_15680 [Enterovibrio nigricans]SKA60323.1 hypothetical protein SAMN02745132_03280 [Enterovibrio nigricans DSM 22720]
MMLDQKTENVLNNNNVPSLIRQEVIDLAVDIVREDLTGAMTLSHATICVCDAYRIDGRFQSEGMH